MTRRIGPVAAALLVAGLLTGCGGDAGCDDPTIRGTKGDDTLKGTEGADVIAGLGGNDTLRGLGGDDVLCGGEGKDVLDGGPGDDHLDGGLDAKVTIDTDAYDYEGDVLAGGPGDDVLEAVHDDRREVGDAVLTTDGTPDALTFAKAEGAVVVDLAAGTVTGEGTDRIVGPVGLVFGSPYDDTLRGTEGPDQLHGMAGADRLEGRGGADFLMTSANTEQEQPPDRGRNVVSGGAGDDEIYGAEGDDRIFGGAGADQLHGWEGRDQLFGGPGKDRLGDVLEVGGGQRWDGGPGRDQVFEWYLRRPGAGDGDAETKGITGTVDLAAATLVARAGDLAFEAAVTATEDASPTWGSWTLLGSDGPNELLSGFTDQGPYVIDGRGGDDTVGGGVHADTIEGGPGRDTLFRSLGTDRVSGVEVRK